MNKSRRIFTRNFLLIMLSILVTSIFLSCTDLFTDNTSSYTPPIGASATPSDGGTPNTERIVTLTGSIRNPMENGAVPSEYARLVASDDSRGNSSSDDSFSENADTTQQTNRAALPTVPETNTKYFVTASATATAQSAAITAKGTVNASTKTFSIPLTLNRVWTITLELKKKAHDAPDEDASYTTVLLRAEHSFGHALTESDVTSPLTLVLMPQQAGTGKIGLSFAATSELYNSVSVELLDEAEETAWNAAAPTVGTSGINAVGIASGTYSVTINFFNGGALVYSTTQTINVFDNLTTDRWTDSGSPYTPIDNSAGTFAVTQALIRHFYGTTFCVSASGDDNDYGSYYEPLETVGEALSRIAQVGTGGEAYTVLILNNLTENVTLTGTALNGKASSITIKSAPGVSATIDGNGSGVVFEIATTVPVSLEKLTIKNGSANLGGGVHTDENTNVTLKNCSVTDNTATTYGGGIYNLGSLTLTNTEITGNNTDSTDIAKGGGVYWSTGTISISGKVIIKDNTTGSAASDLYLLAGKTVTVTGALSEQSDIGIKTETTPGYGQPVQITSGFGTYNSGITPSGIFTSDEGYAVVDTGSGTDAEAVLGAGGGRLRHIFSDEISVTLSCTNTEIASGSVVSVSAAVTKGGEAVTLAADDITWNFDLPCYGDAVASMTGKSGVGYGTCLVPANVHLFGGVNYTLHATAVYKGVAYDEDFTITGYASTVPYGFVAVTGATVTDTISGSYIFKGSPVEIPNFYICDHEVTQAEYLAIMGLTQESILSEVYGLGDNYPAYNMSWFEMIVYCNKRSIAEGLTPCYMINNSTNPVSWGEIPTSATHANYDTWNAVTCDFYADGYRLPTEAEWEYAARGGNNGIPATQYNHSGSDELGDVAWCNSNSKVNGVYSSHEVKTKAANSIGIYDMSGNVWERCWDWGTNSNNGVEGRAVRGGSAGGGAWDCNVKGRNYYDVPEMRKTDDGFRVVRTNDTPTQLPSGTSGTAGTDATYMYFGEWPQTIIASGVTVNESISKENGLFTYYYGSDGAWYVKQAEEAYGTDYTYSNGTSVAQGGTSYKYFKVEPIKWRVLTTNYDETGKKLLLAEKILANMNFYNSTQDHGNSVGVSVHANNYEHSRIRAYLNGINYDINSNCADFYGKGFLQTAFTSSAQSQIANTTVMVGSDEIMNNKVFLLSTEEAGESAYGLNEAASRIRDTTDFAKASGSSCNWWLSSPSADGDGQAWSILADGVGGRKTVHNTWIGVVPAICIE